MITIQETEFSFYRELVVAAINGLTSCNSRIGKESSAKDHASVACNIADATLLEVRTRIRILQSDKRE